MRKLNNKGWSLTEMLLLCAIILIALLIMVFLIYRLYASLGMWKNVSFLLDNHILIMVY